MVPCEQHIKENKEGRHSCRDCISRSLCPCFTEETRQLAVPHQSIAIRVICKAQAKWTMSVCAWAIVCGSVCCSRVCVCARMRAHIPIKEECVCIYVLVRNLYAHINHYACHVGVGVLCVFLSLSRLYYCPDFIKLANIFCSSSAFHTVFNYLLLVTQFEVTKSKKKKWSCPILLIKWNYNCLLHDFCWKGHGSEHTVDQVLLLRLMAWGTWAFAGCM